MLQHGSFHAKEIVVSGASPQKGLAVTLLLGATTLLLIVMSRGAPQGGGPAKCSMLGPTAPKASPGCDSESGAPPNYCPRRWSPSATGVSCTISGASLPNCIVVLILSFISSNKRLA